MQPVEILVICIAVGILVLSTIGYVVYRKKNKCKHNCSECLKACLHKTENKSDK